MSLLRHIFISFLLLLAACQAEGKTAGEPPIYTSWSNNLAVQGYDVVSFYSGKPLPGKSEFKVRYLGADWQFSTRANRDLFEMNPEAFLPQYGGYCAWALAKGRLAKGSAEHFYIEDGRLYLNFNERIKRRWDSDRDMFIAQANGIWPQILTD